MSVGSTRTATARHSLGAAIVCVGTLWACAAVAQNAAALKAAPRPVASSSEDPRVVRVLYAPDRVITVQTRRGQVTHIVLPADEEIAREPATGQGSDCGVELHTWCVAATDGRDLFVKPKAGAQVNNLVVVTTKRRHAFLLVPTDSTMAALRVAVVLPAPPPPVPLPTLVAADPAVTAIAVPPPLSTEQLVANRLRVTASPGNGQYSVAVGHSGDDIVPMAVWDDGRFTYFSFPGHRPLPTLFSSGPDGDEEIVNTHMNEDGLLVADRVARRFLLRLGRAAAVVVNDAYSADGLGDRSGTSAPGVSRVVVGAKR